MLADFDKIICIDGWQPDDSSYEKGYYPEGAREKAVYFSPDEVGDLPLKPKWRYLFKKSRSWAPWQFWMEIMAYRIGQVMDVPVPPAYVGLSNQEKPGQQVYGALIEWFYSQDERYVEGARLISPMIPGYDDKTGSQHNLQTLLDIPAFKDVPDPEGNRRILVDHWAGVLTFDTVIGNVDRHPVNWGVTRPAEAKEGVMSVGLSPAFDNGTAMSWEQPEKNFAKFDDEGHCRRYLTKPSKARHHMRWSLADRSDMNFFDFMRRFAREFPQTRDSIMRRLQFSEADLRARLSGLPSMPVSEEWRLTPRRLDFTLSLIMRRAEMLKAALENV
jgi:hypothetical protein